MKKLLQTENFLFFAAALLAVGFAIRLGADYFKIQAGMNSAPFSLFLAERALEYLLPGVLCLAAGLLIKKHNGAH